MEQQLTKVIIGIDPGIRGGICTQVDGVKYASKLMPGLALHKYLVYFSSIGEAVAYVEKVHAGPMMRRMDAFKLGYGVGQIHQAIDVLGIERHEVTPRQWQGEFGLIQRKMKFGSAEKKRINKAKAVELFPDLHVTHYTADAILICEFAFRREVLMKGG